MKILITGVLGFIGSHFARYLLHFTDASVVGFARFTDQWAFKRIEDLTTGYPHRFKLVYGDITKEISDLTSDVDVIVNFAAKTFVDHSIMDPHPFIRSNILGTYNLLSQAIKRIPKRFIQISTDEVYGSVAAGYCTEDAQLKPTNPYSASKAAADMLALSYAKTYGLPLIITRTENNYGPYQHPQKAIPTFIKKALAGEKLPVYGDGRHRRMWLHVEDNCSAIWHLIQKGKLGEIYNIGARQEKENFTLAKTILAILGKPESLIEFTPDYNIRPGHDRRYAMDVSKLLATGWQHHFPFQEGIVKTVEWYVSNQWWLL